MTRRCDLAKEQDALLDDLLYWEYILMSSRYTRVSIGGFANASTSNGD